MQTGQNRADGDQEGGVLQMVLARGYGGLVLGRVGMNIVTS